MVLFSFCVVLFTFFGALLFIMFFAVLVSFGVVLLIFLILFTFLGGGPVHLFCGHVYFLLGHI